MILFLGGLALLVVGYFTYGRLVERIVGPDDRKTPAEVGASSLVEVVCRFAELPSAGRYRLVVATRCGLGGEYRVVEAGREVEVK